MDSLCGILVIWILCGLIAASLYKKKGRSGFSGFLGGFILGPIGIILALITSEDKEALEKRQKDAEAEKVNRGELKKCPYCAEIIKREAVVCRFCGKELPKEQRSDQAIPISKEDFSKLTYRQQVAVREFKYLLSPEDAEQVGKLMGNFQDQAAKDFCRSYGQAVSNFDE
jgi:hypothetical protein